MNARRRGLVLVIVLVVVALLSLAAYTFLQVMLTERQAAKLYVRQAQARAFAESGVEEVRLFLEQDPSSILQNGGVYDNSSRFSGSLVYDGGTPHDRGRFSLVVPKWEGDQITGVRYGIEDESAKLNLNMVMAAETANAGAGQTMLMNLPGMTEDIADAILDWMDTDDDPRDQGAEADTYSTGTPPTLPRNGPPGSIEELLAVRGVTTGLLFGPDVNRNGLADANEAAGTSYGTADNSDGSMNSGWAAYLTVCSAEANVQSTGDPRINVNSKDLKSLHDQIEQSLSSDWATFIVLYRQNNPPPGNPTVTKQLGSVQLNYDQAATTQIYRILDLVGAKVTYTEKSGGAGNSTTQTVESPLRNETSALSSQLPQLMDLLTTTSATSIPGRININRAPRTVLLTIPGITSDTVDTIVAQRSLDPSSDATSNRQQPTWILSEGLVTLDVMNSILPYVTAAGSVYRIQSIGYFDQGGPAARLEVMIDTTVHPSRVLSWKDMSHLGPGFTPDMLSANTSSQ